jgi:type II secretory pathway component HofQ
MTSSGRLINGTDVVESRFDGAAEDATVKAQSDIDQRFADLAFDSWQQSAEKSVERNSQSAAVAQHVVGSHPAAGNSSRGPWVQLETIEEVDNEPDTVSDAPQQSSASLNSALNARMASLQASVEWLKQSESDRRINESERTAHLRKLAQQSQRLRELELQLQHLQSPGLAHPESAKSVAETQQADAVVTEAPDRFTLQIQNAEITDVLELLGQTTEYNIIIGEGVSGTVQSADLRDVTVVEALDELIHSLDLAFEQDGQSIYVMTKAEHAARKLEAPRASTEK